MKKTFALGILAICCIAMAQQQASAWTNTRFSYSFDWQRQAGGNSICGIWKNGQPPAPAAYGYAPSFSYYAPAHHHSHASFDSFEHGAPAYAMPMQASPFQFANYGQPTFSYPSVYSDR